MTQPLETNYVYQMKEFWLMFQLISTHFHPYRPRPHGLPRAQRLTLKWEVDSTTLISYQNTYSS